jgi:hypothetical protein
MELLAIIPTLGLSVGAICFFLLLVKWDNDDHKSKEEFLELERKYEDSYFINSLKTDFYDKEGKLLRVGDKVKIRDEKYEYEFGVHDGWYSFVSDFGGICTVTKRACYVNQEDIIKV